MADLDWQEQALCSTVPSESFFAGGSPSLVVEARAKAICRTCVVRVPCLGYALSDVEPYGIWGGLTARERRHLLRRQPGVANWEHLLQTAINEYDLVAVTFEQDFADLFASHFSRLVGFLITGGARRQDAEDAVQMAFVELARNWTQVSERLGWLRRVAHRMWANIIAKDKPMELTADVTDDIGVPGSDEHVLGHAQVLRLLERLPEQQRIALAFAYDGCSPAETAQALGVPVERIRQNLHRGRATLARLITEEGILE
ncbi:sigma-70 family RNA polymerase sigma factor [Streptomyces sp. NPDC048002]|uniref:sigma-70 family RNA polymerase sigma factor n=1 Tax=Streptomyces sp. NPDC048002 TaxID=3154344 RepID=UPI0033E24BB4